MPLSLCHCYLRSLLPPVSPPTPGRTERRLTLASPLTHTLRPSLAAPQIFFPFISGLYFFIGNALPLVSFPLLPILDFKYKT